MGVVRPPTLLAPDIGDFGCGGGEKQGPSGKF